MVISYFFSAQEQINITLSTSEAQKTGVTMYRTKGQSFCRYSKSIIACYLWISYLRIQNMHKRTHERIKVIMCVIGFCVCFVIKKYTLNVRAFCQFSYGCFAVDEDFTMIKLLKPTHPQSVTSTYEKSMFCWLTMLWPSLYFFGGGEVFSWYCKFQLIHTSYSTKLAVSYCFQQWEDM